MMRKAALLNPRFPDYYHTGFGCAEIARGDYEAALEHLHKANLPEFALHQAILIATYGLSGRTDDARRALAELAKFRPEFNLESAEKLLGATIPYQAEYRTRLLDGLRRAGLGR
jgi:Flp pilus assembly protein TadD